MPSTHRQHLPANDDALYPQLDPAAITDLTRDEFATLAALVDLDGRAVDRTDDLTPALHGLALDIDSVRTEAIRRQGGLVHKTTKFGGANLDQLIA